jgi:Erv1 / Alr family
MAKTAKRHTAASRRRTCKRIKFDKEDYDSNNGMMTSIWGPPTWHFLHCISFNYPVKPTLKQKQDYMSFIKSLRNVLPCGKCRENLATNLEKLPLTMAAMESRDTFSRYIYKLHKTVNTMLGKPTKITYEQARDRYEHFRARCAGDSRIRDEKGCVIPYYGKKRKCVMQIVPTENRCQTLRVER